MVSDLILETQSRLAASGVKSAGEVRAFGAAVVAFSAEMRRNDQALRAFLYDRMYRHCRVTRMSEKAHRVVRDLFSLYLTKPQSLPSEWRRLAASPNDRKPPASPPTIWPG